MTTFVPFDGSSGGTSIDRTKVAIVSPPPPPTKGGQAKVGTTKTRSSSAGTWEEGQSQLTDDHSYDELYSSCSSYYTTDESADLSGDLDDLKRTFTEALQLIGVGTPVRESSASKKKKDKSSSDSRRSSSRRKRGEMSDRHGRRRRKHGSKRRQDTNKTKDAKKERGPVADSPVRSTPSRPRRRTPSASIMKKPSHRDVSSNNGGPPPPPPPPQVPTLVEWSEAYGIDRELQVVKILVQNDKAKEAYVWQLDNQDKNQKETNKDKSAKSTNTENMEESATDNETTFRLSLHEELLTNKLHYDAKDGMLYFIENVPQSPSDARLVSSASATLTGAKGGKATTIHINQSNKTNRLRIVPQTLRRRLFNVALHQTGAANATSTMAAATTTTAFSVFHRLRSSYYWAGMYNDVHRWWADCERMVLATEAGEMAAVARSAPGTPTKAGRGGTGGGNAVMESPYRVSNELRVTFSQDPDDVDTTMDTCLDMTMDTDDGVMLMALTNADGTPPSSPGKKPSLAERFKTPSPLRKTANTARPDPPGSTASLSSTPSASKTKKILQKAVTSLSPSKISPSRKSKSAGTKEELATVEYTQVVPSGDGSIVSAPPAVVSGGGSTHPTPASRSGTPTTLSDAPTLVRRTSFVSLLRAKSRDVDDDAASQHTAENSTLSWGGGGKVQTTASSGAAGQPQSRRGSSLPPPLSPRASSIRAAAGLPPTSPGLTTAPSSSALKKSESVESFGKRFKGIGKKIAGNRKEDKVCTVTPVVRASPSPRPTISMTATDTDAEPRVPAAHVGTPKQLEQQQQKKEEEEESTPAGFDGMVSSFFDMESASKQFVAFLDTFADALCKDGTSDDEAQVWQRAVPTVIGMDPSKHA